MSAALSDRRFDELLRQFDGLLEQGKSAEAALDILQENVEDGWQKLLGQLGEAINRARSGITKAPGALGPLSRAMVLAAGAGAKPERTLRPMLHFTAQMRETGRLARTALLGRLSYSGLLALLGVGLSTLFALIVLPAQRDMLAFGHNQPPAALAALLDLGAIGFPVLFGALLLLVVAVALAGVTATRSISRGSGESAAFRLLPGFSRLGQAARRCTAIALCQALVHAEADEEWILEEARRLSGRRSGKGVEALELAARIGRLPAEIDAQRSDSVDDAKRLAARCGLVTAASLRALVFTALALLIVSYYLPIFQFGSIVFGGAQ